MQGSNAVARDRSTRSSRQAVEEAVGRLDGVAVRTPLQRNVRLSAATGAEVWLKREDLQVGPLLQAARRLQPDRPARPTSAGPPGWSAPAPATTARASRTRAARSACTAGSSCRARRRARSATGSRRSAATRSR